MKLLIRRARPEDAAVLAELIRIAGESPSRSVYEIFFGGDRVYQRERLERLIRAETPTDFRYSNFFVAEVDGEVAAGACGFDPSTSGKQNILNALRETGWSQTDIADAMERMSPVLSCAAEAPSSSWILEHIATLPRFRRRGLGERVVSEAIEEGFRAGFDRVELSLLLGNEAARSLYVDLGFREKGPPRKDPRFEAVMGTPGSETLLLHRRDWTGSAATDPKSLKAPTPEESLAFWKRRLAGAAPFLALPTDRPRPSHGVFHAATVSCVVAGETAAGLEELCRREELGLFEVLFAAYNIFLSRQSGQQDLVVGSGVVADGHGRSKRVGDVFSNELALRTDLSGNPTFLELAQRVRNVILEGFEHQDLPFEKLVDELAPDLSRPPIFQVSLSVLDDEAAARVLQGLAAQPIEIPESASRCDLNVYAVNGAEEGIGLFAIYSASLFEEERVRILLEQFVALLRQIASAPDKPIGSFSLMTESSRGVLPDPSVRLEEPPVRIAVAEFLSWVSRTPTAEAVVHGDCVLTYADLEARSRIIAQRLNDEGLSRGDVVAVMGPRSAGRVAAMLGVLRSGGILLTLDPALPEARRTLMASEAGARRLLLVGGSPDVRIEGLAVTEVRPDGTLADEARARDIDLPTPSPDDPAYIFFTSGTSGVPKGVLGSQKGLAHFLKWQREEFEIGPGDRCAHLTGLSFDVVLRDVFLPLTSGASLHVPDFDDDAAASKTLLWLERERITALHTVPAIAKSWLASVPPEVKLPSLRHAFLAGEPLTDSLVEQWVEAFPGSGRIVNLYGPTETTLAKCFFVVPPEPLPGIQPIGRPLPNTQALVLADGEQPCGVGEVGEIVLRTPFRTLGYVNAPAESRNRFVPNPFREDQQDLLYRTGDRGRYRLDGSLEILGRLDDQVKIRGVRVEPEEVAAVLSRHPAVGNCAVIPRQERGEFDLVAYVVSRRGASATADELRRDLARQLPAVMIPAAFVFLGSLPLSPNGKVDRAALPVPAASQKDKARDVSPPQTPAEEVVAAIWSSVLGVERIGREDNFFELGGHSLHATQVVSRVRQALGLELSLRSLFEAPTLAQLAAKIEDSLIDEIARQAPANSSEKGRAGSGRLDPEAPRD